MKINIIIITYFNWFNIIIKQISKGISTVFYYQMPTIKTKKSADIDENKQNEQSAPKKLTKIKFNISMDNLRPFVRDIQSNRTTRINSEKREFYSNMKNNHIKTQQSKGSVDDNNEPQRRQMKSPQIFRVASNQILQKIQKNGTKFYWKEIEEVKSQYAQQDQQANKNVWKDHSPSTYCQKNQSIASTADYYPDYLNGYQYMIDSNLDDKTKYYDPNNFEVIPQNIDFDPRTTLMIKNIPNKYTIQFLADQIDKHHAQTYDFLYLPCDIKNNCNVGYGFINFLNTDLLKKFYKAFHDKKWGKFRSNKICNLTYARLQGLSSLIEHFQNSKVLNHKDKKYQPIIRQFSHINHLINEQKSNHTYFYG